MADIIVKIENENFYVDIISPNKVMVDGKEISLNFLCDEKNNCILIVHDRIYEATVLSKNNSSIQISINNDVYDVEVKDKIAQSLEKYVKSKEEKSKGVLIQAPMPGLVLKVCVQVGQHVELGQSLLILEAMKMENEIRAVSSGIVKEIRTRENSTVERNDVLIIME